MKLAGSLQRTLEHYSTSNNKELILFVQKLSILLSSGISLSVALDAFENIFPDIANCVRSGDTLSSILSQKGLPKKLCAMISAAEKRGALADGLTNALKLHEKENKRRDKLIASLTYPFVIIGASVAVVFIMLSTILPAIISSFDGSKIELPLSTKTLMFLSAHSFQLFVIMVVLSVLIFKFIGSDLALHAPFVGRLKKLMEKNSYCDVFASCLAAGIGTLESHEIAVPTINSRMVKQNMEKVKVKYVEGGTLSASLTLSDIFDDEDLKLVSAGERSNNLSMVFASICGISESERDNKLGLLLVMVEPLCTLATGLIVGIIVLSVIQPILGMVNVI